MINSLLGHLLLKFRGKLPKSGVTRGSLPTHLRARELTVIAPQTIGRRIWTALFTVAAGVAFVELWAMSELYGAAKFGGPVLGAVLALGMVLLCGFLTRDGVTRTATGWRLGAASSLIAIVELLFCISVIGTISAVAVLVLPTTLSEKLLQGHMATDMIIFAMLGIGLLVGARGWSKFSVQAQAASRAQIETERARAEIAERDRELARSELNLLRAQIEPHFLWNTLAHLQHLTRKSPKDAEAMTGHLIRFLRTTMPLDRVNMSKLGAEMEAVEAFLELMKIRMGTRLTVVVDLDPGGAHADFPPLLIQTLVENAIKHGIEPKVGNARIEVRATMVQFYDGHIEGEQRVQVEVTDNGVGLMASGPTKGTGMGLRNVRERLRLLYGSEASLRIDGSPEGGVVARIQAPITWSGQS